MAKDKESRQRAWKTAIAGAALAEGPGDGIRYIEVS
jgi:hypothetical protein